MADVITGLACPNCAGALSVREGQRIVKCPYCSARSLVRGERGVRRYQVPRQVDRDRAAQSVRGFWRGFNRAFDLGAKAQITEMFLAYLPYWRAQSQMAGWIFGDKRVRSGKSSRMEPREVQLMEEVDWTGAAADVAEFGVSSIGLTGTPFAAYDPEALHQEGMVFEPTGSQTAATDSADKAWEKMAKAKSGLDRVSQTLLRFLRRTLALVYYPLWVGRYTYRNRAYQVVVDGFSGRVLYGKAPGNIYYRAAMLVAGTAAGAFVMVDGLALAVTILANSSSNDGGDLVLLGLPLVGGAALIYSGYRLFRWGEEIEQRARGQS
jgi:DNA-directed RNA polymerase subunit RPC12/RpoP